MALPQSTLAPVMPVQAEKTMLPQSTVAPATPVPPVEASHSAAVTTPTPSVQLAGTATIAPSANADPRAAAPEPLETPEPSKPPVSTPGETPVVAPTETPTATPSATPPPAPPDTLDDLPDFETFLRQNRNIIAGQSFNVVSLGVDRTNAALPRFVLEVTGSEANDVFAAQSAADLLDYGRRFLDDGQRYLGGAYCAVAVQSIYATSNSDACSNAPAWCQVGAHDEATNTWTVTRTYVRGSLIEGSDKIEAWNAG
jgi:hypothetical protein